jgi:hypothetical protein
MITAYSPFTIPLPTWLIVVAMALIFVTLFERHVARGLRARWRRRRR